MTYHRRSLRSLVLGTTAVMLLSGGAATAQSATTVVQSDQLEQVVVTATRRLSTVNLVPLAVTAETQQSLDQRGIANLSDLTSLVPGLSINQQLAPGVANVAIRGIAQSLETASTTGFYLDDTPLQKRNANGAAHDFNGTPLPPLFDLQRVEVLRGPQGTLYGGSSEGGTVRYITPEPNLDVFQVYAKASANSVDYGSPGYETGVAVGGPIVEGKLGFRASVYARHDGGWIDYVDPYSQALKFRDANSVDTSQESVKFLYQPEDDLKFEVSYFHSETSSPDSPSTGATAYDLPTTSPIIEPTQCFDTSKYSAAKPNAKPNPVATGNAACAAAQAKNSAVFIRPGETYGPYPLKKYQVLNFNTSPAATKIDIPAMTVDYDAGWTDFRYMTSYLHDFTNGLGRGGGGGNMNYGTQGASYGAITIPNGTALLANYSSPTDEGEDHFVAQNGRTQVTNELRLTSPSGNRTWNWVMGLYFNKSWASAQFLNIPTNLDGLFEAQYGETVAQAYGVGCLPPPLQDRQIGACLSSDTLQTSADQELAAYAEVNYNITDELQFTFGVRQSQLKEHYFQSFFGATQGSLAPDPNLGQITSGKETDTPFTPKFGAKYNFTDDDFTYFTASKGFRAGGLNATVSQAICGDGLAVYGLTAADLPKTYEPDTVWSYELGSKLRLFDGKAQINGDIYHIDWNNVQSTNRAGTCHIDFTSNAGSASSQGVEIEAEAALFDSLSLNASFSYVDAQYNEDVIGIHGPLANLVVADKGQKFALSPLTLDVGARYNIYVEDYNPYVRVDWRHNAGFKELPVNLPGYSPDTNQVPASDLINLRVGLEYGNYDFNFYAQNLTNYDKGPLSGGRAGCNNTACSSFVSFNALQSVAAPMPRTVGMQLVFHQ